MREEYIVVLEDGTAAQDVESIARELADTYKLGIKQLFPWALQGFLVNAKEKDVEALTADERVKYVEQNAVGQHVEDLTSATQWTWWNDQYQWHLDRIDETSWSLRDGQHNMCTEGRGAYAYIIDTGIWNGHSEFIEPVPSRAVRSLNFVGAANGATDTVNGCAPAASLTSNYHGTAVASVLAGTHIGAAKTQLVSLRVFDCDMNVNTADMIEALDWIASPNNPYRGSPGVINHSGFVPVWDAMFHAYGDAVVRTVNNTNIPFFTSADNFATDACKFSPNNRPYTRFNKTSRAFVVGGTCVSIYAPAVSTSLRTTPAPTITGVSAERRSLRRWSPRSPRATRRSGGRKQSDSLQNTNTAPTYWMCVQQTPSGGFLQQDLYDTTGQLSVRLSARRNAVRDEHLQCPDAVLGRG